MKTLSSAEFLSVAKLYRLNVAIGQQLIGATARVGTRSIQDSPSRLAVLGMFLFPLLTALFFEPEALK